jgi:hypothetical protein
VAVTMSDQTAEVVEEAVAVVEEAAVARVS